MGMSPNEALVGVRVRLLPDLTLQSQNPLVDQRIRLIKEKRALAIQALNQAATTTPSPVSQFNVKDQVWLEGSHLKMQYWSSKLASKRHGPFQIVEEVSPVAYRLELPTSWRIHDVFHASLLSPYIETASHGPNFTRPPPDLINGEEEYEVEAIINHRHHGRSRQLQYLIKWKRYPHSDNT
jgi:hypothetical protein